jgi:excisionase family DNA binding protein
MFIHNKMDKEFVSIGKAAKMLGVTTMTLRRWDKSGRLKPVRTPSRRRMYPKEQLEEYIKLPLFSEAQGWVSNSTGEEPEDRYYCQTSAVFGQNILKFEEELLKINSLSSTFSLITAAVGEIGNNSFDHNIGNWPDVPGIFFGYNLPKKQIVLADRGQGILKTLKRVRPGLENDAQALRTAFTEIVSGRAPEERGNGLKFVRKIIPLAKLDLSFQSGDAILKIDSESEDLDIAETKNVIRGCLVLIKF